MTCPELRITDADAAECPRCDVCCRSCGGSGVDVRPGLLGPVTNWCDECWGAAVWSTPRLPPGASARIGAILVNRLPHLRHAVWPPKALRLSRSALVTAIGMAAIGASS